MGLFFISVKVAIIRCSETIKDTSEKCEKTNKELDEKVSLHLSPLFIGNVWMITTFCGKHILLFLLWIW